MKVGVIGCGGMGTTHYLSLKVLSSQMDVEVVALADCREEFLQKAAAEFPEARTYTYGMELIERENLDAVHICLPSYLHTEHAVAAMKKGMNVLVEKPVMLTVGFLTTPHPEPESEVEKCISGDPYGCVEGCRIVGYGTGSGVPGDYQEGDK